MQILQGESKLKQEPFLPFMSARLGRNKDAHETLIKGVGQFIFEKEMNKAKKRE